MVLTNKNNQNGEKIKQNTCKSHVYDIFSFMSYMVFFFLLCCINIGITNAHFLKTSMVKSNLSENLNFRNLLHSMDKRCVYDDAEKPSCKESKNSWVLLSEFLSQPSHCHAVILMIILEHSDIHCSSTIY